MISIIDYGAGNLQSVEKALRHIGCDCQVTADPAALLASEAAVLPGVGSFGDAMDQLRDGIGYRAYAQKDPVVEYKIESGHMFDELIHFIREDTVRRIYHTEPLKRYR